MNVCCVEMLVCVCVLQPRGLPAWTSRAPPIVGPRSRVFNVELHGQLASHTQAPVWLGPRCLSSLAAQVRGSDYETRVRLGQCHSDRSSHVFLKVIRSEAFVERPLTDLPHETLRFFAVHSGRLEDKWYHRSHNNCPKRGSVRGLFEGLSGVCFNLIYMGIRYAIIFIW